MSCFFTIVPLMLCAAMSQAAPTVTNSNPQTQIQNTFTESGVPDAESLLSNVPPPEAVSIRPPSTESSPVSNSHAKLPNLSIQARIPDANSLLSDIPPAQTQVQNPSIEIGVPHVQSLLQTIPSPPPPPQPPSVRLPPTASPPPQHPYQPVQCPAQAPPCPPACKPSEPNPVPTKITEKPPEKKTGWVNGFKNVINVCYKAVYEGLVGKEGFFTNLVYKTGDAQTKKPKKNSSNTGNTKACCVFYNSPPSHVKDENDDEKPRETNITVSPVNCFLIKSKSSTPGAPAVTPLVPGATTNSKSDHVNCCCVGEKLMKIVHCVDLRVRPQFNCCAVTFNASVVE